MSSQPLPSRLILLSLGGGMLLEQVEFVREADLRLILYAGFLFIVVQLFPLSPTWRYRSRHLFGLGMIFTFGYTGFRLSESRRDVNLPTLPNQATAFLEILEEPQRKAKTYQATATLLFARDSTQQTSYSHKSIEVFAYIPHAEIAQTPQVGDRFLANLQIYPIENRNNPFEFDYKQYLARQGIHHRVYATQLMLAGTSQTRTFKQQAAAWRSKWVARIDSLLPQPQQAAFLSAILLGDKADLSRETKEDFSTSGLSHVLAVSGLHTGFVFVIILALLFPLLLLGMRRTTLCVAIVTLWGYAWLTGLSPSVCRASCMITIMLVGRIFYQGYNSQNALYLTAILLLVIDPLYLQDLGFLLSFAAVQSILLFYKPIHQILSRCFPFYGGEKLSSLLSISISAQVLTLPISIYSFHVVPTWFLLSNLVVVPLLPFLMGGSILLLTLASLGVEWNWANQLLGGAIEGILQLSHQVAGLPGNTQLYWEQTTFWVIFGMLLFLILLLNKATVERVAVAIVSLALVVGGFGLINTHKNQPSEIILFNHNSNNDLNLFYDQRHYIITEADANPLPENYASKPYLERYKPTESSIYSDSLYTSEVVDIHRPFMRVGDHRFCLILDNDFGRKRGSQPVQVDYLVIGDQFYGSLASLASFVTYKQVILLASLKPFTRKRVLQEADSCQIATYDIQKKGAFRLPL